MYVGDESHLHRWPGPSCWTQTPTLTAPPSAAEQTGTFFTVCLFVFGAFYNHSLTVKSSHTYTTIDWNNFPFPSLDGSHELGTKSIKKKKKNTKGWMLGNCCKWLFNPRRALTFEWWWKAISLSLTLTRWQRWPLPSFNTERRFVGNCCPFQTVLIITNAKAKRLMNADRLCRITPQAWRVLAGCFKITCRFHCSILAASLSATIETVTFTAPIALVRQNHIRATAAVKLNESQGYDCG